MNQEQIERTQKALQMCSKGYNCTGCMFLRDVGCKSKLMTTASSLIRDTQAELEIAKIQNQYISEVASAYEKDIEKLERERDAAVKDLAIIKFCHTCKFDKYSVDESDICYSCVNKCYWEWRGLCEENGGAENA